MVKYYMEKQTKNGRLVKGQGHYANGGLGYAMENGHDEYLSISYDDVLKLAFVAIKDKENVVMFIFDFKEVEFIESGSRSYNFHGYFHTILRAQYEYDIVFTREFVNIQKGGRKIHFTFE